MMKIKTPKRPSLEEFVRILMRGADPDTSRFDSPHLDEFKRAMRSHLAGRLIVVGTPGPFPSQIRGHSSVKIVIDDSEAIDGPARPRSFVRVQA